MTNFGANTAEDSIEVPEEIRQIARFNGLKGMIETLNDLIESISSTVILKNNKEEAKTLKETVETIKRIKIVFYDRKERFFVEIYKNGKNMEIINREYFEKIKEIISVCYINTEILMTRNKLLFSDSRDELSSDEEIKKSIMDEYVDG